MNTIKNNELSIFLMGGTKDSINIIKFLKEKFDSPYILTTTTTEEGGQIAKSAGSDEIISEPLSIDDIITILKEKKIDVFIDSTHPFAVNATKSAIKSSEIVNIPYIRFERPLLEEKEVNRKNIYHAKTFEDAGKLIANNWKDENVLHLAGVNTIEDVLKSVAKKHFYVRVLPIESSIKKCKKLGINGEHIIAMQGIFSKKFNKSLMRELNTKIIITKESGEIGGVLTKLSAANELGIIVILIDRPEIAILKDENVVNNLNQLKNKLRQN
ncbi:MAG: precorrin-6A reductase [Methanobacteriaceae archaeon]|nr:precorrin-6A reductase [Candidatus Methanorudis spinitermitis]